jgi:hypothetical protein
MIYALHPPVHYRAILDPSTSCCRDPSRFQHEVRTGIAHRGTARVFVRVCWPESHRAFGNGALSRLPGALNGIGAVPFAVALGMLWSNRFPRRVGREARRTTSEPDWLLRRCGVGPRSACAGRVSREYLAAQYGRSRKTRPGRAIALPSPSCLLLQAPAHCAWIPLPSLSQPIRRHTWPRP